GNYPLSAAQAAESTGPAHEEDASAGAGRAARAFFWQGPGSLAPYLLALSLLELPEGQGVTSLQFRVLLGAGALPALVILISSLQRRGSGLVSQRQAHLGRDLGNPRYWRSSTEPSSFHQRS
ncbi:unnamed protein product, partial [Polarella glacialis]